MVVRYWLYTVCFTLICSLGWTQTRLFQLEFKNIHLLKGDVNSYGEETYALVTQSGQLVFNRSFHHKNVGGEAGGQDIWFANPTALVDSFAASSNSFPTLNSIKSNAVIGFGNDGKKLYLLNTQRTDKKITPGISFSEWKDNQWAPPTPMNSPGLSTNSEFYSAHVFANGTKALISMAGLPNTTGGYDMYLLHVTDSGWSNPMPLSNLVNSVGNEISPFYDEKNQILYFASNGHEGAQGFDIYYTVPSNEEFTEWSPPTRLPNSINSAKFEAYFSIINDSTAVFSSNKSSLLSDIYITNWNVYSPLTHTSDPLALAGTRDTVYIRDTIFVINGQVVQKSETPTDTNFTHFKITKTATGKPTDAIAYFDLDQKKYQQNFELNMDSIADYLTMFPAVKVALSGHTCNLGAPDYNDILSKSRSEYVKQSLIRRGISADRISIRWFGSTRPSHPNTTEHNRKFNRRVEFSFIIPEQ